MVQGLFVILLLLACAKAQDCCECDTTISNNVTTCHGILQTFTEEDVVWSAKSSWQMYFCKEVVFLGNLWVKASTSGYVMLYAVKKITVMGNLYLEGNAHIFGPDSILEVKGNIFLQFPQLRVPSIFVHTIHAAGLTGSGAIEAQQLNVANEIKLEKIGRLNAASVSTPFFSHTGNYIDVGDFTVEELLCGAKMRVSNGQVSVFRTIGKCGITIDSHINVTTVLDLKRATFYIPRRHMIFDTPYKVYSKANHTTMKGPTIFEFWDLPSEALNSLCDGVNAALQQDDKTISVMLENTGTNKEENTLAWCCAEGYNDQKRGEMCDCVQRAFEEDPVKWSEWCSGESWYKTLMKERANKITFCLIAFALIIAGLVAIFTYVTPQSSFTDFRFSFTTFFSRAGYETAGGSLGTIINDSPEFSQTQSPVLHRESFAELPEIDSDENPFALTEGGS